MTDTWETRVRSLSLAKALTVAAYGESVAAYRYRTLFEKAENEVHRSTFDEMADEEQGHHVTMQDLLKRLFPGSDFVLTPEDKELVIVGPRMLDLSDAAAFGRSLEQIYESERLTGRFYATFSGITTQDDIKPLLTEMADECFDHAKRLKAIPPLG